MTVLEAQGEAERKPAAPAPALRSLRTNFAWTLMGNVVYAASQWGMLAALARLGEPAMVGEFALALAVSGPVFMLTNLNTRVLLASDARRQFPFGTYLRLRRLSTGLGLALVAGLSLVAGYGMLTTLVVLLVGLAKSAESMSDLYYGLLQRQERVERLSRSLILRGLLGLGCLAGLVLGTGSLVWGVLGLAGAWWVVMMALDGPAARSSLPAGDGRGTEPDGWHWPALGKLALLALPQGVTLFLIALTTALPRLFVERQLGLGELGIFAALGYFLVAGSTVVNALGQAALPRLAAVLAGGDRRAWRRLLGKLTGMGMFLGGAGILVAWWPGPHLLTLVYGAEYAVRHDVFTLLMVAAGLGYVASLWGYALTAARVLHRQAWVYGLAALATFAGLACWVPETGLHGASWALMVGAGVQTLGSGWLLFLAVRWEGGPR